MRALFTCRHCRNVAQLGTLPKCGPSYQVDLELHRCGLARQHAQLKIATKRPRHEHCQQLTLQRPKDVGHGCHRKQSPSPAQRLHPRELVPCYSQRLHPTRANSHTHAHKKCSNLSNMPTHPMRFPQPVTQLHRACTAAAKFFTQTWTPDLLQKITAAAACCAHCLSDASLDCCPP